MKKPRHWLAAVIALLALAIVDASACGDKFLVVGRGPRASTALAAPRPANVLIFQNPGSDVLNAVKDGDLKASLEIAGHTATVVTDATQLEKVLAGGRFDIVLADIDDAAHIQATMGSKGSKPAVLPVMYNASSEAVKSAKAIYAAALRAPARSGQLLAAIDDVVAARARTEKKLATASAGPSGSQP